MTNSTVSVKAAEAIARLATLLGHPLRVRLMNALAAEGPGSATSFSGRFGDVSVGDCHYHLTALKDGGVIELVRSRKVRGATERIYRLRPRSRWRGAKQFQRLVEVLLPAATPGEDATLVTLSLLVDEDGFSQVTSTVKDTVAAMHRIGAESEDRLRGGPKEPIRAVVKIAAFHDVGRDGG